MRLRRPATASGVGSACCDTGSVPFTLVSFHAHPDDESLLTGGTLARAAAEGHRVVLVTATAGERGLSSDHLQGKGKLGSTRETELRNAAAALGCARVVLLGYGDSGSGGLRSDIPDEGTVFESPSFADSDPDDIAERLAEILREENADVLTIYDPQGGYGHRDHVQVHRVGLKAASLAQTRVVLEATVDRDSLMSLAAWMGRIPRVRDLIPADQFGSAYLPRSELTHRVDVRPYLRAKRAALAAHHSQSEGGRIRTVGLLLRLPGPLLGLARGTSGSVSAGARRINPCRTTCSARSARSRVRSSKTASHASMVLVRR